MASGGARTRSGPAPDPNALARDKDRADWVTLPAEGRSGAPPKWPLVAASKRELVLWRQIWKLPQATEWERQEILVEPALYIRRLVEAEQPGSSTMLGTLVRQMGDSLGLTMVGMRANRWRVEALEDQTEDTGSAERPSARDRFRVVDGGA